MEGNQDLEFSAFFADTEERLRLSLIAAFGNDLGRDATAEALAWAWQNWMRLRSMDNPVGYIFRVGQTHALKAISREKNASNDPVVDLTTYEPADFEPKLAPLLAGLTEQQRIAVWLVHGMGYRLREVAELLDCSLSTVATHARRGLIHLQHGMETSSDV